MIQMIEVDWWVLFLLSVAALALATEIGFRFGRRHHRVHGDKSEQITVQFGAILGLLGLLLAFSFSIVENRFAARKKLVIDEANSIGTTYLRAKMLPEPYSSRIQTILRKYVDLRIGEMTPEELEEAIAQSERYHTELWEQAEAVAALNVESVITGWFIDSLNETIDLHTTRVTVSLHQRLPRAIFDVLLIVSLVSLAILGYREGLSPWRSVFATIGLIIAISSVIVVIDQLDTPGTPLFQVSQSAMEDLHEGMQEEVAKAEANRPGGSR